MPLTNPAAGQPQEGKARPSNDYTKPGGPKAYFVRPGSDEVARKAWQSQVQKKLIPPDRLTYSTWALPPVLRCAYHCIIICVAGSFVVKMRKHISVYLTRSAWRRVHVGFASTDCVHMHCTVIALSLASIEHAHSCTHVYITGGCWPCTCARIFRSVKSAKRKLM